MTLTYAGIFDKSGMVCYVSKNSLLENIVYLLVKSIDLSTDQKKSFLPHNKTMNNSLQYIVSDEICYVSAATDSFPHRICFNFLEHIKSEYTENYRDKRSLKDLKQFMNERVEFYSSNPTADKLLNLSSKIEEIKEITHQNINDLITRGENIKDIQEKALRLSGSAVLFQKQTDQVRCTLCKKNMKMNIYLLIIGIILCCLLLTFIIVGCYITWKTIV